MSAPGTSAGLAPAAFAPTASAALAPARPPGGPSTLVGRIEGSTHVALLVDRPPTAGTWWYTVRGVDAHGWVGRPSAEASVVVVAPSPPSTGPVASPSAAPAGPW